jgi:hypothetical protein
MPSPAPAAANTVAPCLTEVVGVGQCAPTVSTRRVNRTAQGVRSTQCAMCRMRWLSESQVVTDGCFVCVADTTHDARFGPKKGTAPCSVL